MDSVARYQPSKGKIIGYSIIAIVLALLHPFLFTSQTMLLVWLPTVYVIGSALLYAGGGRIPSCILMVGGAAFAIYSMGTVGIVMLPITLVPAIVITRGIRLRQPFFTQMRNALIVSVSGALVAIVLSVLMFHGSLISEYMEQMRTMFEEMLPQLYSQVYQPLFESYGMDVTYDSMFSIMKDVLANMQTVYQTNIPSAVITDSVFTALIALLWGNRTAARHGEATADSFKGLADWKLPGQTAVGLLVAFAAAALLSGTSLNGAQVAWTAICNLVYLAFAANLLCANDRRMRDNGATRGRRTGFAVLFTVLISLFSLAKTVAFVWGAALAIFGRDGYIAQKKNAQISE